MTNATYIHLSDKEIKLNAEDIRRAVNYSETSLFFCCRDYGNHLKIRLIIVV